MATRNGSPARVLIAGAGIGALETALALRRYAPAGTRIALIAPGDALELAPLATLEAVAGWRAPTVALADAAAAAGAELVRGSLAAVEPARRTAVTEDGRRIPYDRLVVAVGARREEALPGAVTFRGPPDAQRVHRLLEQIARAADAGVRTRLAVVVPTGPGWPAPAYELALLIARHAEEHGCRDNVDIGLITHEQAPLGLLGPRIAEAVAADLARAGIDVRTSAVVRDWAFGWLELIPQGRLAVDRVITLPVLRGPALAGLPHDRLGFLRAGADGRVEGVDDVLVVGDAGPFPLKHGGIAAQEAHAAASRIAIELGAAMEPVTFDPVLATLLLGGDAPRATVAQPTGGRDLSEGVAWLDRDRVAEDKVPGRLLAPLVARLGAGSSTVP